METDTVSLCDFLAAKLNYVAENKNSTSSQCLEQYGGVKATRMAHLVMVCIVSLAVASTIGFALLPNMALRMDTASSKDLLDAPQLARIMTQKIRPLGDPIDDPKPNSVKH